MLSDADTELTKLFTSFGCDTTTNYKAVDFEMCGFPDHVIDVLVNKPPEKRQFTYRINMLFDCVIEKAPYSQVLNLTHILQQDLIDMDVPALISRDAITKLVSNIEMSRVRAVSPNIRKRNFRRQY